MHKSGTWLSPGSFKPLLTRLNPCYIRYPLCALSGVATTTVVCGDSDNPYGEAEDAERPFINIVQRGPGAIPAKGPADNATTTNFQRWGDYSAAQVLNGQLWYVVPIPIPNEKVGIWKGSWIGVLDL